MKLKELKDAIEFLFENCPEAMEWEVIVPLDEVGLGPFRTVSEIGSYIYEPDPTWIGGHYRIRVAESGEKENSLCLWLDSIQTDDD